MKNEQIKKLYQKRARIYDFTHHLETLWADTLHRKEVVRYAHIQNKDNVLDLGTGTGITVIEAHNSNPNCKIVGIDFCKEMLEMAKAKYGLEDNLSFVQGDLEGMPFDNNKFDVIISAYGLGSIGLDINKVFKEVIRVAKPKARIVCAEMAEPSKEYPIRRFIHNYFVEPWIKHFWNFKDLDLQKIFKENYINIKAQKYFTNRLLGSTNLVSGIIRK